MARKRSRISRRMLFTWFILGAFIMLLTPQKITNQLQLAFAHIFHWPLSISRNIMLSARTTQPIKQQAARSQIQLQNRNANLEAMLAQELQRNKNLTNFLRDYPMPGDRLPLANITKISGNELVINLGETDGLKKDQFVLADNSIIGRISEVSAYTSKVMLTTSPLSKIPAAIGDKDVIIKGDNKQLKVQLIQKKYKFKPGDKLFCKPMPGFLFTPVIIGTVAECKPDTENLLLWDITVQPACDIESLTSVNIIIIDSEKSSK